MKNLKKQNFKKNNPAFSRNLNSSIIFFLQRNADRRCRALYDCEADNDDELTFEQTVYTKGKKIRVEMQLPISEMEGGEGPGALRTVMINNGAQAWIISPFGERKELTEEEARWAEEHVRRLTGAIAQRCFPPAMVRNWQVDLRRIEEALATP